jgi:hypothetical protein
MSKRDYITEILSKRSRLKRRGKRWEQVTDRIDNLIDIADLLSSRGKISVETRHEIAKYLPVGFVACLEGLVRLIVRDLIDSGSPFRENIQQFKDLKFGTEHVVQIHRGTLTLGEFISHLLPLKGIADIEYALSTITGSSFHDAIKNMAPFSAEEFKNKTIEELGLANQIFRDTQRIFELRHIYSHELAPRTKVNIKEIISCSRAAFIYMLCADNIIKKLLGPAT